MNEPAEDKIQAAFTDIWKRNLPLIHERLAAVERAAAEIGKPSPALERVALGCSEAHKLAGVLGTFGLARGTALAQALEEGLDGERSGDPSSLLRLAAELRSLVDGALL